MQVYKGMDIGTAKPSEDFCKDVPHHLINLISPEKQFNVSDFIDEADKLCKEIFLRGNLPVICGGTGFYIRSFMYGLPKTPESDPVLRQKLKDRIKLEGNKALYEELQSVDPDSAKKIHVNDEYRILRALEVYYLTGNTRTSYKIEQKLRDDYDFTFIVLEPPRDLLHKRIEQRVDKMFEAGLKKEVDLLINQGYGKDSPGMKAIGYQEWFLYDSLEKIKERIIHNSKKYAKKQYTYIRDIPGSITVDFCATEDDIKKVCKVITEHIDQINNF
jgi:tRNA dimethylallyltransferase